MSAGKRSSTSEPLTEHDVAERLDRAAVRTLRILMDARQIDGLAEQVRGSRYLTNSLAALAAELQEWGVKPQALRDERPPAEEIATARDRAAEASTEFRRIVQTALASGALTKTDLARAAGISRPTLDAWQRAQAPSEMSRRLVAEVDRIQRSIIEKREQKLQMIVGAGIDPRDVVISNERWGHRVEDQQMTVTYQADVRLRDQKEQDVNV